MKAVVLSCFLCLVAINPVAAQPAPSAPGANTPASRFLAERLARAKAALKADAAGRVDRSIVDRGRPASSIAPAKLIDMRLDTAVAGFQQKLQQMRLQQIEVHKRDPQFLGVIDSMKVGDMEISLERRKVRTDRGLQSLLLTRFGNQYVYDGDMVVPWSAVETGAITAQAAGVAGTFGRGTLWDDATVPFETDSNFCCRDALEEAIAFYHANTIFRFIPREGHPTYVRFVNAEPVTTSRTDHLGKQQGENIVRIQPSLSNGQPADDFTMRANIMHEMGHVLGLIHEHLRSDRDKFIVRNPSCMQGDLFRAVRDAWIDIGQTAFVDNSAELLTTYDFDSIMHYDFRVDVKGDGSTICFGWVRIGSCPNGDVTSPLCNGFFSSPQLTTNDITGLQRLYGRIPNDPDIRTFTDENVRYRGRKIDRCLQGLALGKDGCSAEARSAVANAFCEAKGFRRGVGFTTKSDWGEHSGYDAVVGWKNVWGTDIISSITCEERSSDQEDADNGAADAHTFAGNDVKVSGRKIDRCVHGNGIRGDRCSEENQKLVADRFCQLQGFDHSTSASTDFGIEVNATGFRPANNDFQNVSASDIFTEVACIRPPPTAAAGQEFSGNAVKHRGMRIDRCLQGTSFGEDGCSQAALQRVATEFCRVKGFRDAKQIQIQGDVANHSVFDKVVGWKTGLGTDAISFVRCENQTEEAAAVAANALPSKDFGETRLKVSGRPIDRCVHGDGITGDRCSTANQRRVANKFCRMQGFDHSSGFATDTRIEVNAIGFRPKNDDFQNVSAADIFTEVTCIGPPT